MDFKSAIGVLLEFGFIVISIAFFFTGLVLGIKILLVTGGIGIITICIAFRMANIAMRQQVQKNMPEEVMELLDSNNFKEQIQEQVNKMNKGYQ